MSVPPEPQPSDSLNESDGSITEDEDASPSKQKEPALSLSGDLSCGICLSLLRHPYTVIPCLHTFDKSCLSEWWKSHGTCPACKEKAKSARFSFQLNSILEYHRAVKKRQAGKTELVSKSESLPHTSEEIYPLSNSNDGYDSDSGSEPDYEIEAPRPAIAPIHDGVMWPCRSCSANNDTGYQCPHPIPNPSTDDGSADPISRPTRGDARLSLVDTTTMQFRSETAAAHRHCDACTTYLPVDGAPIQCRVCKTYTCSQFDPSGCPRSTPTGIWDPVILVEFDDINRRMTFSPVTDFSQLWNWCEYPLASNHSERTRFVNFMTSGTRTPGEVQADFERSVKRWLLQQSRLPPRRQRDSDSTREDTINVLADRIASSSDARVSRGADALDSEAPDPQTEPHWRVCNQCIMTTARLHFFRWWTNERAIGTLDASVTSLDHCWYGRECRTQTHNHSHASRYNHICENTSVARGRGRPEAQVSVR